MQIRMDGPGADEELRSLRLWLLEIPEIRQHAKISWLTVDPQPEEMSAGALDALQLVTDNLWQMATFSLAYATWRKTRVRSPRVTVEYNGKIVTIEGDDSDVVERVIRTLAEE
ncbi:effector-associated constant component EACC1 [Streptomyces spectabilis]|nr:hypothetical protein [Streptomyces spectabilis]MCI3902699.1 hypothetical protein [Streptomyces spectabilis]GGV44456.1 hypothetical protein GCM10010245_69510 [Streptomyces spectabilis]